MKIVVFAPAQLWTMPVIWISSVVGLLLSLCILRLMGLVGSFWSWGESAWPLYVGVIGLVVIAFCIALFFDLGNKPIKYAVVIGFIQGVFFYFNFLTSLAILDFFRHQLSIASAAIEWLIGMSLFFLITDLTHAGA